MKVQVNIEGASQDILYFSMETETGLSLSARRVALQFSDRNPCRMERPLFLSLPEKQLQDALTSYLQTALAITTPTFESSLTRLLDTPDSFPRGPFLSIGLPFQRVESKDREDES